MHIDRVAVIVRAAALLAALLLCLGCAQRPFVGITISNSPESIESCGKKMGGC
jgi:hypothetical protein